MSQTFADQLREAIRACGESRYALAKRTGISQAVLSRFMAGKAGLGLESINTLMDVLELEVRPRRKARKDS